MSAEGCVEMDDLCRYASRPIAFILRYVRRRPFSHGVILVAVLAACACSVGTQYGVKLLVDTLDGGTGLDPWLPFGVLVALIAADNMLWRLGGWIAASTFVGVTGDLRSDLFRHLTGHSPSYFAGQRPGTLTSRITATSNATYMIEHMFMCNVLPPCVATVAAVLLLLTVSTAMTAVLLAIAGVMVIVLFHLAAAGAPLHQAYASKAATVDGEMVDVVGNMAIVRAFGGLFREHRRFDDTVGRETRARRGSLRYLERLRLLHAGVTVILATAVLAWAVLLWQRGAATTGDVVLVAALGVMILSATRDLAVALVDVTQYKARLAEALETLLVPHELSDHPAAMALPKPRGHIIFDDVTFRYPGGRPVLEDFRLEIASGERVGLVGPSGGGKSTLLGLLQRFHDVQGGRILIDGRDIAHVTDETLRAAISVVPQDTSLLHRTLWDNIAYGRPEASEAEVLRAIELARCGDFIDATPQGVMTVVGDRGVKLSGGQRQRIAIARALVKDAPILLLDEATSALDTEFEEAIRDALDRLMRGRTVIAIAHRIATLRNFDRIVVLEGGRIVEDGPPDQLMRDNGPYRRLVTREMTRLMRDAA
jgi:ATP-binding cassette subfamily B protein